LRQIGFQHLLLFNMALLLVSLLLTVVFVPDRQAKDRIIVSNVLRRAYQWDVRANSNFFRLMLSAGIYNLGFYIALDYLQYYVTDSLKLGPIRYATVLAELQALTILGALAGTIPAGILADRISRKRIIGVSCVFSAAAMVVFAMARAPAAAITMAVFFGVGYGAFRAVDWAFACRVLPQGGAAKYMAIWSLASTIPQVFAPAFGPIADKINASVGAGDGWRAAMGVAAVCIVGGALLIRTVDESPTLARAPALKIGP
jgi:MFS family permease